MCDLGDAVGVGRGLGLGQKRGAFCVGFEHGIEKRGPGAGYLLGDAADPGLAGDGDIARFKRKFAPDQAEERGLAGAVPADESHLVAVGNRGRGALEQGAAFDGEAYVLDPEHGAGFGAPRRRRQSWLAPGRLRREYLGKEEMQS